MKTEEAESKGHTGHRVHQLKRGVELQPGQPKEEVEGRKMEQGHGRTGYRVRMRSPGGKETSWEPGEQSRSELQGEVGGGRHAGDRPRLASQRGNSCTVQAAQLEGTVLFTERTNLGGNPVGVGWGPSQPGPCPHSSWFFKQPCTIGRAQCLQGFGIPL